MCKCRTNLRAHFPKCKEEEDEDEEDEDEDEEEEEDDLEDDEVLVASFEVVGREHSILGADRNSCITHIGLATQEQSSALENGYYMHSGDKGGRIQWQPSRLGKLPQLTLRPSESLLGTTVT